MISSFLHDNEMTAMKVSADCLDQLFIKARTANGFLDKPVPMDLLKEAYDIAKMGATSMNTQPTRYVFLLSKESRARLLPALSPGNLDKTRDAPVTVIVATDTKFYEHMAQVWHKPGAKEMFEGNAALATTAPALPSTAGTHNAWAGCSSTWRPSSRCRRPPSEGPSAPVCPGNRWRCGP